MSGQYQKEQMLTIEKLKSFFFGDLATRAYNYLVKQGYRPVAVRVQDGSYVNLGHLRKKEIGTTIHFQRESKSQATLVFEFDDLLEKEREGQEFKITVNSLREVKDIPLHSW